ncbi:MAG: sporulation transcriptional regulator SpoIIID [Clostridia bacterium]|nr:sporulation transcriptional regulator SpoIIID [Clostridia bacterium]
MKDLYIYDRATNIANYIIETNATVRTAASVFGVSKSTVHKDITERLESVNHSLANDVKKILDQNKAERHIRGGEATRKKYATKAQIHNLPK